MALAWYWLEAMRVNTALVVTHRMNRKNKVSKIRKTFGVPSFFYPDASITGTRRFIPRLAEGLDLVLLLASLPFLFLAIKRHRPNRIFAFFGGGHFFLIVTWLVKWISHLPLEIYLVDDLEAFAHLSKRPSLIPFIRWTEKRLYAQADRVFCISEGYCKLLKEKYQINSSFLPVAGISPMDSLAYRPFPSLAADIRYISFCGSLNDLYYDSVCDLYDCIKTWNEMGHSYRLGLLLVCMHKPDRFLDRIQNDPLVQVKVAVPREALPDILGSSWATFLPYSFSQEAGIKGLVQTAFSCKVLDSFKSGRPILVYGPLCASIPIYFRSNRLPLVAASTEELFGCLAQLGTMDQEVLVTRYRELALEHHTQAALRRRLLSIH